MTRPSDSELASGPRGWSCRWAGGLLFALRIAVVLTSAGWYLNSGWPRSGGY
jgi:hypothetical protein